MHCCDMFFHFLCMQVDFKCDVVLDTEFVTPELVRFVYDIFSYG